MVSYKSVTMRAAIFWWLQIIDVKSHYLRASDSLNYGLEIEKIDFLEILPIFNFCQEMNKNAYFSQFSLPYPWQPRFSIFSIFQQYFELKITIFWTALPKRQCGKCLCLCFQTINMTYYFTLVLILLLFRCHGNTCYDGFLHAIMHFSMH